MSDLHPSIVILAGPNGAGKSTAAPELLQDALAVNEFVNADVIARGLSAFDPESAAIAAGRTMLARIRKLAEQPPSVSVKTRLILPASPAHLINSVEGNWACQPNQNARCAETRLRRCAPVGPTSASSEICHLPPASSSTCPPPSRRTNVVGPAS